jgi:hypothetical protein
MKGEWEETAQWSQYGSDVLVPLYARDSFNESVHKLAIATGEVESYYFETSQPFLKSKTQGRPYDGIPVGWLMGKVDRLLRKFEDQ